MDRHDEQFETFLRQFRLRTPGPVPQMEPFKRRTLGRWVLAAAAVIFVAGISTVIVRNLGRVAGPRATVEVAGNPSLYKAGQVIDAGTAVRSNSAEGLTLSLEDGSHIEMRAQSELVLESAGDGIRVKLSGGSILVSAAKQHAGHLYVQTRDSMVSVVGTVFFVKAEQSGTRVAVIEGEVHVLQGTELKKLLPGEQVATNSSITLTTVADEISWSRNAAAYVALLQQAGAESGPLNSSPVLVGQAGGAPEVKYNDLLVPAATRDSTAVLPIKVQPYFVGIGNEVRTLIAVQIMTRDLAFQDVNGAQVAEAEIKGVVLRSDSQRAGFINHPLLVQFPSMKAKNEAQDQPNLYQEALNLVPGKYRLQLTVQDKNSQNVSVTDTLLSVPRVPAETLQASSMILANSVTDLPKGTVGTEMFALGDKIVKPNVTGVFRSDQSLNVWQEIYGLTVDQATSKPSATFELAISDNKQELRVRTNPTGLLGSGQKMTYSNSVPLWDFAPGEYDVRLKVTDDVAKVSFVTPPRRFSVLAIPTAQSDPSRESSGPKIFDRECVSCHSAEVALKLVTTGAQFSVSDRELLANKRAELAQQLMKGFTTRHPDVVRLQSEITALESRARNSYSTFVLRHVRDFGGTISGAESPMLVEYLFETVGKGTQAPVSPTPQQQPPTPEAQGKRIFDRACTTCHNASAAASGNYSMRSDYENLVKVQRSYGASVSDAEFPVLVDYLFNTFGKKSEPVQPRGRP